MARRKDVDWFIPEYGAPIVHDQAQLAVLMDLRDELKRLNSLLHCSNFTQIPHVLRGIRRKLPAPKKRKVISKTKRKKK